MPVFRLFGPGPGEPLPPEAALVHLDDDAREVGKVHEPAVALVGDPGLGVAGLLERLGPAPPEAVARRAREVAAAADARRLARARVARAASGERVGPAAFARAVAAAAGPRDLVVDEALTSARSLRSVISRRTPATWLAHRGSALGWGLPAAVGAKLADRGRRVMALQGDGSLLFGAQALWTAAHEGLGVALVVADNGGYEILRAGLEGLTGRPEGAWPGLALAEPRLGLEEICRGYGASAARVERQADLAEAMADLWRRAARRPRGAGGGRRGPDAPRGLPGQPDGGLITPPAPMRGARAPKSSRDSSLTSEIAEPPGAGVPLPTSSVGRMRARCSVPSGASVTCSTMLVAVVGLSPKTS